MEPIDVKTSIRTIAKLAGTSVTSVSRVLNNSGYTSADVREKVEAAIKELNYTPSKGARMLRGEPSRMIGLLLPSIDLPFFGILAHSIEQQLFERGYQTLICSTAENREHEERYISMLLSQRVDGVIVASAFGDLSHFRSLASTQIPIVGIDREMSGISKDAVMADHIEGGRMMAKHLLDLGHRKIAVIGAPGHSQPIQLRLEGVRQELAAHGLAPAKEAIGEEHRFAEIHEMAQQLLRDCPGVTGLIGTTDIAAIAAIHAIHHQGHSVPQDYSVIGFDDLPEASHMLPRLTTIAQPIREVGLQAVERLEKLIDAHRKEKDLPAMGVLRLPVTLVERESTGPARL
jgi:LacI family transcriptional regulator